MRKTSDSNKRQRIVASKSHPPTSSSIPNSQNHPQLPLSDITPSKSNYNFHADLSASLTQSIPVRTPGISLSSAHKFSQQYGSTTSMSQTFSNQKNHSISLIYLFQQIKLVPKEKDMIPLMLLINIWKVSTQILQHKTPLIIPNKLMY
jgi:hypothetical protein